MKKLLSCLMALLLAAMPLMATAEGTEGQNMSDEEALAALAAMLPSYAELEGEPEIGTWYHVTPENALTATGEQWHGLFKKGSENKVMIYYYGGGVSIDNHTAANADEFYNTSADSDGLENFGIAMPNEESPFGNWSVCVIPYVNGDFHCGTGEFDFDEDGKTGTVLHHGWTNYTLLMDRVMPYIGTPDAVLITGFSAGGFGTALNANDTFTRYFPDTENLTVFVDSSLLLNDNWHDIAQNVWHAPESIVGRLTTNDLVLDSLKALHEDHPTCKILFGCSIRDEALASVQNYIDNGINDAGKAEGDVFQTNLTAFVGELTAVPNTAVFIWGGISNDDANDSGLTSHTTESFPTVFIPIADGLSVAQWVSEGVNGNLTNHGVELLKEQREGTDMSVFSLQTALKDAEPLENVEQRRIDISYINKNGEVTSRPIIAYIPTDVAQPMPCVYVPHYAMAENAAELRRYIAKGWAVVSPADFDTAYNGYLTDDDLVFNNAALYAVRHMPEIDNQRIALIGGSAGGYTTLMLSALQMGSCCAVATAPIANVYFNFHKYFPAAKEINDQAMMLALLKMAQAGENQEQAENAEYNETDAMMAFLALFQDNFPLPYLAMVEDNFITINDNFPDPEDTARWEVLSAVGIADCFSAPLVIVHCTSDILVPIDQITREFTYPAEGDSMPEGFSTRLDASYPGKLGHSLVEELPTELVSAEKFVQSEVTGDMDLPYRQDALISVDVFDDGPTQSWGSHSAATESNGDLIDTGFVEDMFAKGLAGTERLMPGKLLLMLERYQGKSVQLPTHEGVDDTVYGSLAIYQREVVEELAVFSQNHSLEELDAAVQEAVSSVEDEAEAAAYTETWSEIKNQLS